MSWRKKSDKFCHTYIYTFQFIHTLNQVQSIQFIDCSWPNIVDLLRMLNWKRPKHKNLTWTNEPWNWGKGKRLYLPDRLVHLTLIPYTKYSWRSAQRTYKNSVWSKHKKLKLTNEPSKLGHGKMKLPDSNYTHNNHFIHQI